MTFNELSHEQQVALVALVEAVTMTDGYVSDSEETAISGLAEALGDATYRALLDEIDERFPDLGRLKTFLETIEDTSARELIYGTILEETMASPSAEGHAVELLDWLRATWDIRDTEA